MSTRAQRVKNSSKGLCTCGRERAPNRKSCQHCLDKALRRSRHNKAAGLCRCGKTKDAGSYHCQSCIGYHKQFKAGHNYQSTKYDSAMLRTMEILNLQTKIENEPIAWIKAELVERMRKLVGA